MPEPIYHSFEEYWENKGARIYAATHEERARLSWEAALKYGTEILRQELLSESEE